MNRRKPELQALDVTTWPTVAWTELDAAARERFRSRMQAIERYALGESVKDIEDATGVNRRQLYRLLERALEQHHDGRIFGYRALIAHVRVTEYVRVRPSLCQANAATAAQWAPSHNCSSAIQPLPAGSGCSSSSIGSSSINSTPTMVSTHVCAG
jgi:hypothetical protein